MRLRKYLVKRIIHMVVTLIIVLVLLFVLFRLMPGSAAQNLFMKPGISEVEKNQIAVRYGFAKWVDTPGNNFINTYTIEQIGEYTIVIETGGDTMSYTFDVNAGPFRDTIPPRITAISASPGEGASVNLTANVTDNSGMLGNLKADIQENYVPLDSSLAFTETAPGVYDAVLNNVIDGRYNLTYMVADTGGNTATATQIFDVTADPVTGDVLDVTPILTIWNVGTDSGSSIKTTAETVVIQVEANGTFSSAVYEVRQPDNTTAAGTLSAASTGDMYTADFVPAMNGMHTLEIYFDGDVVTSSFPVNSPATSRPASPADSDGAAPILSELSVYYPSSPSEYPLQLREGASVNISVLAVNEDGERWTEDAVNCSIILPDGSIEDIGGLNHPQTVETRSHLEQFYIYMKNMLVFDFGESFEDNRPVWDVITERIPATLLLFGTSLVFSYAVGIMIGVVVAWRRGTALELGTIVVTLFFYSMPIFWSALIAQWIFYSQLGWFPLSGFGGADALGNKLEGFSYVTDVLWHLTLPLATMTVLSLAGTILLMRSSMLEVMGEDFITTARAKGLKQRTVVYKHAARNAMLPVVTSMALALGGVISGGVLTETIFSWPGMGTLLVKGTLMHNYPVVQGAFYILAMMTIIGNMMADILYAYLDPRVQL